MATMLLRFAYSAFCGRASQVLRDQLEIPERRPAFGAGRLERSFERVADVVVDQGFLGAFDGALHRLQLLGDLAARSPLFNHLNDLFEVAIGAFQTPGNRRMRVFVHVSSYPPGRISAIPPGG